MYATCLYCHSNLGRNERLPRFPVGKRLAFDEDKGRLWVICGGCGRWNLSPLEERHEAIEACERMFRGTRVRVSTDNIGLAEMPDGLMLVRIGKPLWPEFAAWRYGRRFSRRRLKSGVAVGALVGGAVGVALCAAAAGFIWSAYAASYATAWWVVDEGHKRRPVKAIRVGDRVRFLRQDDAEATRIFHDGERGNYGLALHHSGGVDLLRGPDVRRILGQIVPTLSPFGGDRNQVRSAIEIIDDAGSAEACISRTMEHATRYKTGWLSAIRTESRLAIEMSLQEDGERRALDGELQALESAWREAEQIAAIADNLLMPSEVIERLTGLRHGIVRRPGFAIG